MINELLIEPFVDAPEQSILFLDYDGSLAPIVSDPMKAGPFPGAIDALRRLAAHLGRVAIISGRPVQFIRGALEIEDILYAGLYGYEIFDRGEVTIDDRVFDWKDRVEEAAIEAEQLLPGVLVERKDSIAVSLHWRDVPDREIEVRACAAELAAKYDLSAPDRGRKVVELRPPLIMDKGVAIAQHIDGYTLAAYAGDDLSDLPAFRALHEFEEAGQLTHALRIGVRSEEEPMELIGQADLTVDGPEGLVDFLHVFADVIERP